MKAKSLGLLSLMAAALLGSCSSDNFAEFGPTPEDNQEVDVTFTLLTEQSLSVSRADDVSTYTGPGVRQTIGKAAHIDKLIYAVYDEDYTLLTQYGNNDYGQCVPADFEQQFRDNGSYSFTIRLMRNKVYHMAFWAQSSECDAYNTDDLSRVMVSYEGALNSDELRDAFCKTETFSITPSSQVRTIMLTRPFAQINVATTGADYNNFQGNDFQFPNRTIEKSRITLSGVSNCIDVVKDVVLDADENLLDDVTFDWNDITAYINGYDPSTPGAGTEEFLYVDLNNDGDYEGYAADYPTIRYDDNGVVFLTETFKYLSMCYALVPASKTYDDNVYEYTSSVLKSVQIAFGEDGQTADAYDYLTLYNVPVHRNWRTNILGGFHVDKPTDNSSIFNISNFIIDVDSSYYDDSNIFNNIQ